MFGRDLTVKHRTEFITASSYMSMPNTHNARKSLILFSIRRGNLTNPGWKNSRAGGDTCEHGRAKVKGASPNSQQLLSEREGTAEGKHYICGYEIIKSVSKITTASLICEGNSLSHCIPLAWDGTFWWVMWSHTSRSSDNKPRRHSLITPAIRRQLGTTEKAAPFFRE